MGSGGGSTTTTRPQLPRELSDLFSNVSQGLIDLQGQMPIGNFAEMPVQQFAGLSPAEQAALNLAPGILDPTQAGQQAYQMAGQLGNPMPWMGTDLGGIGGLPSLQFGGFGGGFGMPPGATPPHGGTPVLPPGTQPLPGGGPAPGGGASMPNPMTTSMMMAGGEHGGPSAGGARPPGMEPPPPTGGGTMPLPPGGGMPAPPGGGGALPITFTPTGAPPGAPPARGTIQRQGTPPPGAGAASPYNIPGLDQYRGAFGGGSGGTLPREPGFGGSDRVANPLHNIDFANHPALQSAMDAFSQTVLPGLENQMGAMGLTRSGGALKAVANAQAQMALPVMQQLMGLEMQGMGLDIGQRGQDIQSGIAGRGQDVTQRGQDIQSLLNQTGLGLQARGQDIGALLQGRGQDLSRRGQDIGAILGQGSQALQARGQDIGSLQAGLAGMLGLNESDLQRQLAGIDTLAGLGGRERSIEDARFGAEHGENQRRFGLAYDALFGPLGGLQSQIGTSTYQSGGGK